MLPWMDAVTFAVCGRHVERGSTDEPHSMVSLKLVQHFKEGLTDGGHRHFAVNLNLHNTISLMNSYFQYESSLRRILLRIG